MAGRGKHVDVNERRLKPVYDCLDNGNNKKAVQEADRLLRKQKDLLPAKALKALALVRLDKSEEAAHIISELHDLHPTEEVVVQPLLACYKELQKYDKIVELYENACKVKVDDEDLMSGLFMAYVRVGDYNKQQLMARSLHKLRPAKNPYYFWAIMSIVMQARASEEKKAKILLPLAEKMTSKYIEENKIEADAEVLLYLLILEHQQRYQLALDTLAGPLGERLGRNLMYREEKTIDLLVLLERWLDVAGACRKLLDKEPDSWKLYTTYLNAVFKVNSVPSPATDQANGEEKEPVTPGEALTFIQQQQSANSQLRGPQLALLEMARQARLHKVDVPTLPSPKDVLIKYYRQFGDRSAFFTDVKDFISLLDSGEGLLLVAELMAELEGELGAKGQPEKPADVKVMYRHISLLQLSRYISQCQGQPVVAAKCVALAENFIAWHTACLPFGEKAMRTEFQPSDPYLLLAAHYLHDAYVSTGDCSHVISAIACLEAGLKHSSTNSHFKLLLLRLYATLGAHSQAAVFFDSLDIKHMLYDALGYLLLPELSRYGCFTLSNNIHDSVVHFFSGSSKEITENLLSAYKYGSFIKVEEMVCFKDRLLNSIQFANSAIEQMLSEVNWQIKSFDEVVTAVNSLSVNLTEEAAKWAELRDNRDLAVVLNWDNVTAATADDIRRITLQDQKHWVRLRSLYLRCTCAVTQLASSVSESSSVTEVDTVKTLLSDLRDHADKCSAHDLSALQAPVYMQGRLSQPPASPLSLTLSTRAWSLVADSVEAALHVQHITGLEQDQTEEGKLLQDLLVNRIAKTVSDLVVQCKQQVSAEPGKFVESVSKVLERAALTAETVGLVCAMLGACHAMLKTRWSPTGSKQHKKKVFATVAEVVEYMRQAVASVKDASDQLMSCLGLYVVELTTSSALSLQPTAAPEAGEGHKTDKESIQKNLASSYQTAIKDIELLLQAKLDFLATLRFA